MYKKDDFIFNALKISKIVENAKKEFEELKKQKVLKTIKGGTGTLHYRLSRQELQHLYTNGAYDIRRFHFGAIRDYGVIPTPHQNRAYKGFVNYFAELLGVGEHDDNHNNFANNRRTMFIGVRRNHSFVLRLQDPQNNERDIGHLNIGHIYFPHITIIRQDRSVLRLYFVGNSMLSTVSELLVELQELNQLCRDPANYANIMQLANYISPPHQERNSSIISNSLQDNDLRYLLTATNCLIHFFRNHLRESEEPTLDPFNRFNSTMFHTGTVGDNTFI